MAEPMTYERCLAERGTLTYWFRGTSMRPLLRQGKDLFTVTKKTEERCKKYDVVLYRGPSGRYILHRVVQVCPDSYVILGDNCVGKEYGIRDADILGVMTSFTHNGRTVPVTSPAYRLYSRVWVALYPLRALLRRVKGLLRR